MSIIFNCVLTNKTTYLFYRFHDNNLPFFLTIAFLRRCFIHELLNTVISVCEIDKILKTEM